MGGATKFCISIPILIYIRPCSTTSIYKFWKVKVLLMFRDGKLLAVFVKGRSVIHESGSTIYFPGRGNATTRDGDVRDGPREAGFSIGPPRPKSPATLKTEDQTPHI